MSPDRLRQLCGLEYFDPKTVLENLRRVELNLPNDGIAERVRALRTSDLKPFREARDAALFAYGQSCVQGHAVGFAPVEDQDYDFVTTWAVGDTRHVCTVQLKELVPEELNPNATINDLLEKLCKYGRAPDLIVAVKMNRLGRFDPAEVRVPPSLHIGGLWMFCAITPDQNEWAMWGDFIPPANLGRANFSYPKPLGMSFR